MIVPIVIVLAFAFVALAIGGWLLAHLMRQETEIERRLARLESAPGQKSGPARPLHPGLVAGSVLNDFELPNLAGDRMTLSQWHGRRLVLIFVRPGCRHSRRLIPLLLARGASVDADQPLPVFISTGDADPHRALFGDGALGVPVLLQEDREVAHLLRVTATPAAYLVDPNRVTEAPLIFGVRPILAALGIATPTDDDRRNPVGGASDTTRLPLEWSETPRPPALGTPIPSFNLPELDGGTIALGPDVTRRTLVVLVDLYLPSLSNMCFTALGRIARSI